MNDFTKEELETILKLIINDPMKYHDALESKLESLINNYCDHKWDNSCCGCTKGVYCEKCWVNLVNEEDYDEETM